MSFLPSLGCLIPLFSLQVLAPLLLMTEGFNAEDRGCQKQAEDSTWVRQKLRPKSSTNSRHNYVFLLFPPNA